jgi:hypothetical protein
MKIIINIDKSVDDIDEAIRCVNNVISDGYQSGCTIKGEYVEHYCWMSIWKNGLHVLVNKKKNKDSADSFTVWKK